MPTIFLARHGQTDFSREDQFCGTTDPPLNALGREMAAALAERCAGQEWVALYTSPLRRTVATAEAIGRRIGRPPRPEPGLREIAYGEWETLAAADVKARFAERYAAWSAHPAHVSPPGGETASAIAARAVPVIEAIARRHPEGNVLAVSHKATIRVLVCALLGIDLDVFRVRVAAPVASLTALEFQETGPLLVLLGDVSHLPAHLQGIRGT